MKQSALLSSAKWAIEQLEQRTLLSGSVFSASHLSHFTPTSSDISDLKNGPLAAAGQHLADLYTEYKSYLKHGGSRTKFVSKDETLLEYKGTSVTVTLRTLGSMAKTTTLLHSLGAELIDRNSAYSAVDAFVPVSQLSTLMANSIIATASPAFAPVSRYAGVANNQGDIAENADSARTTFGVDGTGVKVGVISNSVNEVENGLADSVATHDLPKGVQVIQDLNQTIDIGPSTLIGGGGGDDEGRAMLEEIHDIAPGAKLAFATSGNTQAEMARNIVELVRAGCKIIVDDIGFPDEPLFQEGVIGQAITDAVENHGVTYLSAAGNSGAAGFGTDNAHWVQDAAHQTLLDFDPSSRVDTRMRVDTNGQIPITLEWGAPYNGVAGAVDVDLDIQFIDPTTGAIVAQGNTDNLATGTPVEIVQPPPGTYDVQISVANEVPGATLPSVIQLTTVNGGMQNFGISNIEYPLSNATIQGHSGQQDVISVGAVPWYLTPPYNNSETVTNEDFSALGPVTYYYKANGQARSKALVLDKPDVSGTDGVNTSFFGSPDIKQDPDKLLNFFGTSAAAPNVAAVAALMLQVDPTATPAQITNALITSAKDNPVNGQKKGSYNDQSGFGLVDALQALHALAPTMPVAELGRVVADTSPTGVSKLTIQFSSPVTGFDLSDLTLTRGKGSTANLLTDEKLTTTDNTTFVLSGLTAATSKRGTYTLTLAPGAAVDAGNNSSRGGSTSFVVSGQPTDVTAIPIDQNQIEVSWTDNTNNEIGFVVTRALNASFTDHVKTFDVKANTAHFKDTTVSPGTAYYYRVTATEEDGGGDAVSDYVGLFSTTADETIVDNRSIGATFKGNWSLGIDPINSYGGDFITDDNTGKGTKTATFTPAIANAGQYYVYVYSDSGKKHSTKVPVSITSAKGTTTQSINEKSSSGWVLLGLFPFATGKHGSVTISNAGTKGTVIADAVRFQASGVLPKSSKASSAISIFGTSPVQKNDVDSVLE